MTKDKEFFGLHKVPDGVLLKESQTELGKANAYIIELEEENASLKKKVLFKNQALDHIREYLHLSDEEIKEVEKNVVAKIKARHYYRSSISNYKALQKKHTSLIKQNKKDKEFICKLTNRLMRLCEDFGINYNEFIK